MPREEYFELAFRGPWKGANSAMPENIMDSSYSPSLLNMILKNGEIRTRPRQSFLIPGPPDNNPILVCATFTDSNNVAHTVIVTATGLWQLNPNWRRNRLKAWNQIGSFPESGGLNIPVAYSIFLDKFFWTNGGTDLWMWDGISSIGSSGRWTINTIYQLNARVIDSNGNIQIALNGGTSSGAEPAWNATPGQNTTDNTIAWVNNGVPAPANGFISVANVDATNGINCGAFFLGELNFHLLMLNTVEGSRGSGARYPQRVRWSPSGLGNIWDPNVNIGAGYNDEIDVPEEITGFLTIGRNGFIFRTNGITELSSIASGTNPFDFNHLWASNNGIGNVFPFSIAGYGPIGIFIAEDDIYNLSLGGFKKIGGMARDVIYNDIAQASNNPICSIIPILSRGYSYPVYRIAIPFGVGTKIWDYSIEDDSWQPSFKPTGLYTGRPEFIATF